ncbi:MAG: cell division protein FtsA [Nitrospirae bacterium CG_4_10_14_3_um_filter_53_41]|nr:MAG: cell division protein FtsA [Nitrospirae bacterium CG17_big_fil_post_rev_8_21_14_2_50_50_9]PIW84262.1 MAG: cell division protein FtsA [Nitrospirae bacterium CG_4_8_14_3_um_filter_50_41]PIX85781.1 MAG: cell division protein FtsA [Nitrospirae bacterium CG_4_10_14_3_um_filter_53_41]
MAKKDQLIVGLDLGTTKICVIVGSKNADGKIDVIGIGTSPSKGLRKGVVVNIDSTVETIKKAVEEAELMAGCEITSVYAGIAGAHIKSLNSRGVVAIKEKEVNSLDVDRVIDAAKAISIPMDREVIHVFPQEFIVDDQDGIKDPIGMSGVRLEAEVHIVTASVTSIQNIIKSCNRAGLEVKDIVLESFASSLAVLTPEEREMGVSLFDLGGGTTDLAIFLDGSIWHTSIITVGGNNISNDISVGIRTPISEAERIKIKYGCAKTSMVRDDETIEVPSVGGRPPRVLSRQILSEIIEPRVEELFSLVKREIVKTGYEDMITSGVVLTGGTSIMDGMVEIAEEVMGLPARLGVPRNIGGLVDVVSSPMYATAVGLVQYGFQNLSRSSMSAQPEEHAVKKAWMKIKKWVSEFF